MNITVFCQYNPLQSSGAGGIGTLIRSMIANAPPDFRFEVVGVSDDPNRFAMTRWYDLETGGRHFRFLPILGMASGPAGIPLGVRYSLRLRRILPLLELEGRILHFHRPEPVLPLLDHPAPKFVFIHNSTGENLEGLPFPAQARGRIQAGVNRMVEDQVFPRVGRVYSVRESLVETYRGRYPELARRFHFMPTWVDTDRFKPPSALERLQGRQELAERTGWGSDDPLLVFVGRLEPQKDPELLIESFRQVRTHWPRTRLLVLGEGSLRGAMELKIRSAGLSGSALMLGNVPHEQISKLLGLADCFLLTSRYEGMPVAVLEALASGVPVVSTDAGEVKRVIAGGGGRLVKTREAGAIAREVAALLAAPPTWRDCLAAIAPYTAAAVLGEVYAAHREVTPDSFLFRQTLDDLEVPSGWGVPGRRGQDHPSHLERRL